MKKLSTFLSLLLCFAASAQWSNTTNQFYDSLHMPVAVVAGAQKNPLVLRSYPDSGFFVIWEDERNFASTKTDIYAQKYDKNGLRLWAENGLPVVTGPNAQYYAFNSNQDYRNRSFAATDSVGGFYIAYADDSVNQYFWSRMCIQHMLANGTPVFGGAGFIAAATPSGENYNYSAPLLIADGNKGCFLSYSRNSPGSNQIFVSCYRDEGGGVMKNYGGGHVNFNALQRSQLSACGIRMYLDYPGTTVNDYNIWPDGQGGCNVVMGMNGNSGLQGPMLAFNRVWRAKKNSIVKHFFRNTQGIACPQYGTYIKDNVYVMYQFGMNITETICKDLAGNLYVVTSERMTGNGYLLMDIGRYDYNYPKGVTIPTAGNINADVLAVSSRMLVNNSVTNQVVYGFGYAVERYDSVPYQAASSSNPDLNYNGVPPSSMDALAFFRDTLVGEGVFYPDFSLAGGGGHVYAASLMTTTGGPRDVRLQHLAVEQQSPNNFAFVRKAGNKKGELIGKEISTGFSGYNIFYDHPLLAVNNNGQALFYIRETGRSARVSPVLTGAKLEWGAMGVPIGMEVFNNAYYNVETPHAVLDPFNGTALMAWRDNRYIPGTFDNIFMRHLDNLNTAAPAYKTVRLLPNPYGGTVSNPIVITGVSTKWSTIETFNGLTNPYVTPVAAILDNVNIGSVLVSTVQNSGAVRRYNGQAYLDRNFTIVSETAPASPVGLRLFFTETEFNALKAADNSITSPGDLIVIKQPNANLNNTPLTYAPVAGEQVISPTSWAAVPGGYYLELNVDGFSNFFIQKPAAVQPCVGGNVSIAAGLSGSSYQWQVNTGSGFVNVSNGGVYSGANTASLQLTGAPSSWYGYQYRCVVDGVNSVPSFLKFSATWTGAVNNAWENAGNWSCGLVPDANTDVVVNSGAPVLNVSASVRTLTLGAGINMTVKSGSNLTVVR